MKGERAVRANIERWQDAFRRANGRLEAPRIEYERGWYYVGGRSDPYVCKWRAKKLEEATERLLARPLPEDTGRE